MRPHDGRVHRHHPVDPPLGVLAGLHRGQQPLPRSVFRPAAMLFIDRHPMTEPLGKIPPRHPGAGPVEHPVDHLAVIVPPAATHTTDRQERPQQLPLLIRQITTTHTPSVNNHTPAVSRSTGHRRILLAPLGLGVGEVGLGGGLGGGRRPTPEAGFIPSGSGPAPANARSSPQRRPGKSGQGQVFGDARAWLIEVAIAWRVGLGPLTVRRWDQGWRVGQAVRSVGGRPAGCLGRGRRRAPARSCRARGPS